MCASRQVLRADWLAGCHGEYKRDDDVRSTSRKAQHVIKSTAREYWQNYCNTLDKSTKLRTVWKMAHKMNGFHRKQKIRNLIVNGVAVETNEGKAETFAKSFSDISSDNKKPSYR